MQLRRRVLDRVELGPLEDAFVDAVTRREEGALSGMSSCHTPSLPSVASSAEELRGVSRRGDGG